MTTKRLSDLLADKDPTEVLTATRDTSVLQATQTMNEHRVGCLVVAGKHKEIAGVFTERDLLARVVAKRLDPAATTVGEVMTTNVICGKPGSRVDDARAVMRKERIRHLPIVDDDKKICGLISIGDLNAFEMDESRLTIQYLEDYVYGRVLK